MSFSNRATTAIELLDRELQLAIEHRESHATDDQLRFIMQKILDMKGRAERNELPPKRFRYPSLGKIIIDQWPLKTRLGDVLVDLEHEYMKL
jgi:hypothetical protein